MIQVETYTTDNGSTMRVYDYRDIALEEIAQDLIETVKGWDYAVAWDAESDETIGTIFREGDGYEIEL